MTDLVKDTRPPIDMIDTTHSFSEIYSQERPPMGGPLRSCTAAETNQYVKDRILPSCSIEGALNENLSNGNLAGAASANEALSVKQDEWKKANQPPQDPASVMERQYKENLENSGSLNTANRVSA